MIWFWNDGIEKEVGRLVRWPYVVKVEEIPELARLLFAFKSQVKAAVAEYPKCQAVIGIIIFP